MHVHKRSLAKPCISELDLTRYEESEAMEPNSPVMYELTDKPLTSECLVASDEEQSRTQMVSVVEVDIQSLLEGPKSFQGSGKNVIEDDAISEDVVMNATEAHK
mmetsp:Transcript_10057/g.13680  ORF Transcript_10057/g.13680 Transcript_10057/m.13680 type:complete len:104 (+) Transcript_10057:131-442(+)|eukprot:CAMPEP_0185597640 /NCGR_PEP_ID=MMETSP0434-20130131/81493_1 /TAXON_ID=626734 ORGANISM="Favella taraikaensis, Strain Fe Narragansett Bay" /NCGR_SAMPLE_ID=MMETSP0434 /ASSEMBLY_ACC=CAM_ASM_000379 /LENGTH=103 /DNA_ID=CAMNT_0028226415 /DNA_START=701 /DNA_END=1012 /DNA_ORIENTATION=-